MSPSNIENHDTEVAEWNFPAVDKQMNLEKGSQTVWMCLPPTNQLSSRRLVVNIELNTDPPSDCDNSSDSGG